MDRVLGVGRAPGRALAGGDVDAALVETVAAAEEYVGSVAAVVTDYDLPDGTGFDVARTVRDRAPDRPCLLYTDRDPSTFATGPETPVVEYVPASVGDAGLRRRVGEAIVAAAHSGCPVPEDEPTRAAAVAELDTSGTFDDLAGALADEFGVPVAGVGVLEPDRYRVLACHGGDLAEVSRSAVPCSYAVLGESVTVIEGLTGDPRFAGSPVVDAGLDWYAGAPVRIGTQAVGTVHLFDRESRDLDADDRGRLRAFADEAADRLRPADGERGARA
jgi:GAF domain-containing protein